MGPPDEVKPVRPLDAAERRVLGTLIEKGKTTPDQYPLSLNALVNGCNQKSNRAPVTSLDEEQVTRALASLRQAGAVAEVFGNGKIPRYRHLAYEWLAAGKEELAILGELLLRGAQSEGDLRGRASRMDLIPDLDSLRAHLDRLAERGLIVWLSPPGRGRMLTHGLLPPETLAKVRSGLGVAADEAAAEPAVPDAGGREPRSSSESARAPEPGEPHDADIALRLESLEAEVIELRSRVAALESRSPS